MKRAARLSLLVLVAGALLGLPATAQTFRVVTFGDSVTYAIPFDLGGGSCSASSPDTCGHTGRLASSYNCKSGDCSFTNRGRSGEMTAQGLTRLDGVLREKNWDLMVLMEGTNDLADVSAQTALFNLNAMADKAESRGVGVARASIIQFNPSVTRAQTGALNSAAKSLRNLIAGRASADKQCFVDSWAKLCNGAAPGAGCFVSNYWTPAPPAVDFVGHPNSRGYDILGREFHRVLGSRGAPGAVELSGPEEDAEVCGTDALVSWSRETVAGARCGNSFRIQISSPNGTRLDRWFFEGETCGRSGCSTISPVSLKKGNHSVRIQTRNTAGYGPWSAETAFSVVPTAPKQIQALRGPEGAFYSQGGLSTEFKWKPDPEAISYRLEIRSGSKTIFDESLTDLECSDTECAYDLGQSLETGRYTWRVMAENVCGGTWSRAALFEVFDSPPATAPAAVGPVQRVFDNTPIFRWKTVPGADSYELEDAFGGSVRLAAADVCQGDTCRRLSAALAPGLHTWRVRAANPLGDGAWSSTMTFEVVDCDCFEGKAAGGASFLLAVPENWNRELVIWAHASNEFGVLEIPDFSRLAQRQFDQGYALGTTSYSVAGWPTFRSKKDLEKVFTVFSSRYGRPKSVYLAGESAGALVAAQALENAKLGNVVGALAMCGPLAGKVNWEGALDLRLAYDAVCAEAAGAEIPGGAKGLPNAHGLAPGDIAAAVDFCTGLAKDKNRRSAAERRRLKDLLSITGLSEGGLQDAMRLATFGMVDLVRDKKKLKGKVPIGNVGVDYGDPEVNATIARVTPESKAENKLEDASELDGKIGDAKVLSLHTSKDPVFFVENLSDYSELVPEESFLLGVVKEPRASHCGFSEVEELAAWKVLTGWTETGNKPNKKALQKRCVKSRPEAPGACRFDNRPKVGGMDERVRGRG